MTTSDGPLPRISYTPLSEIQKWPRNPEATLDSYDHREHRTVRVRLAVDCGREDRPTGGRTPPARSLDEDQS
jgi:hypothetical protein